MATAPLKENPLTHGIAIVRMMVQRGHSLGVTGIAKSLKMPKSSVHRLLQSLVQIGFVQKIDSIGRYTLSADIFDFVHEIAWTFGRNLRLDDHLRAAAHRLNCNVYISMMGRRDTYVICAAGEEGNTNRLGVHGPAYATSAGKALIAQKDRRLWRHYAPQPGGKSVTRYTNQNPRKFLSELRKIRKTGIAWNMRESSESHVSLATVIREPFIPQPRLTVALVMRMEAFPDRDPQDLEAALLELAAALERELGSR